MRHIDCPRESDVMSAVYTDRWPDRVDAELRDHVAACVVCRDLVEVVAAFEEDCDAARSDAHVPESANVWWRAQVRAREDAARVAVRPITAAQVIAVASICGAAGAIFGATSGWFQRSLQWLGGAFEPVLAWRIPLPSAETLAALVAGHGTLLIGAAACLLLAPVAVYFAVRGD
jgi:hypothetical protein